MKPEFPSIGIDCRRILGFVSCLMAVALCGLLASCTSVEGHISGAALGERYVESAFDRNGYVILRIGGVTSEYVLIGPNTCISLGEYSHRFGIESRNITESSSIVYLSYTGGRGTGVHHYWKLVIILREWRVPLYVNIYSDGYVSRDWGLSDRDRKVRLASIETLKGKKGKNDLRLTYSLLEDGKEIRKVTSVCTMTEERFNKFHNHEVLSFMGFGDE